MRSTLQLCQIIRANVVKKEGVFMEKTLGITALGELLIDYTDSGATSLGYSVFVQNPGGAPANMLTAAAKQGIKTAFIGKVGEDFQGHFLQSVLGDQGIDCSGLVFDKDANTTLAFVSVSKEGERDFSFIRANTADTRLDIADVNAELIKSAEVFHFGSLSVTHELSRSATYHAIKIAKESGAILTYDPNYRPLLWNSKEKAITEMRALLQYADIVKMTEDEAKMLTDCEGHIEAFTVLSKTAKVVLITLGSEGCYIGIDGQGSYLKGFSAAAVDSTGAGDCFFGTFMAEFLKSGKTLEELTLQEVTDFAHVANAAASVCVERFGGIPSIPNQFEVKSRLDRGREI